MLNDLDHILLDQDQIAQGVRQMALQIASDLAPSDTTASIAPRRLTLVPILTGSLIFLADLIRHLPMYLRIELISVSSYPGTRTTAGKLEIQSDLTKLDLVGHDVLVIDDILDSGRTLQAVTDELARHHPASLRTCVLLRKPFESRNPLPDSDQGGFNADYACFDIPDEFVVGYGLDYNDYYRNLPYIATLHPSVIGRLSTTTIPAPAAPAPETA